MNLIHPQFRRVDDRTVELGFVELWVEMEFTQWLDRGYGIPQAVAKIERDYEGLNPEFVAWLAR